jgi:hypothetical protein
MFLCLRRAGGTLSWDLLALGGPRDASQVQRAEDQVRDNEHCGPARQHVGRRRHTSRRDGCSRGYGRHTRNPALIRAHPRGPPRPGIQSVKGGDGGGLVLRGALASGTDLSTGQFDAADKLKGEDHSTATGHCRGRSGWKAQEGRVRRPKAVVRF